MTQGNSKANDKIEIRKCYYASGELWYETPYVNGKEHGIERMYYKSGALQYEAPYVNGNTHGILKLYYESGALDRETLYVNGNTHGISKTYDREKSNIVRLTLYTRDRVLLTLRCES